MASLIRRATVYRLTGVAPTPEAMFDATSVGRLVESGMDFEEVDLAGAPGLLYYGQHPTTEASWTDRLSHLSGVSLDLTRHDSEALLIVAVGEYVYAVGFGRGYLAITDAKERGFGLRCALRLINPQQVQDVVRHAMGGVSRQDSTFVPSGIPIQGIGVHAYAELVKKLGGLLQAGDLGLSHRETVSIVGSDGLQLPIPMEPEEFLALLHRLNGISERAVPSDFAPLEGIQPVRDAGMRAQLDRLLSAGLRGQGEVNLQIVIPARLSDQRAEARSYRISIGSVPIVRDELDFADLLQRCSVQHRLDPVTAMRKGRIDLCADDDGRHSLGHAPASHWIEATASIGPASFSSVTTNGLSAEPATYRRYNTVSASSLSMRR